MDGGDGAGDGGAHLVEHLHRLQDEQDVALLDRLAGLDAVALALAACGHGLAAKLHAGLRHPVPQSRRVPCATMGGTAEWRASAASPPGIASRPARAAAAARWRVCRAAWAACCSWSCK